MSGPSRPLLAALCLVGTACAQERVLGAPRKAWATYRQGGDTFTCFDGKMTMPIAQLNGAKRNPSRSPSPERTAARPRALAWRFDARCHLLAGVLTASTARAPRRRLLRLR